MSIHRGPSPYRTPSRAPSPYSRPVEVPYEAFQSLPTGPAQVGPGAVTYTASTGPDGRITYHLFRAVAASYPTPNGLITGIQWVPSEATTTLPPGVIPPSDRFGHKEDLRSIQDWEREDERRRKQEEKEAKRLRALHNRNNSDYELQLARDRDAHTSGTRERRQSFIGSGSVPFPQPAVPPGYSQASPHHGYAYPTTGYGGSGHHGKSASVAGVYDLSKQMGDMELRGERERKLSSHSRKFSVNQSPYERARTISGGLTTNPYPATGAYSPYSQHKSMYSSASPNPRAGEFPQGYGKASSTGYPTSNPSISPSHAATTFSQGGYPPGHILYEPSNQARSRAPSRPASRAASRGPSPNPAGSISRSASPSFGRSPHIPVSSIPGGSQQLPAPGGFSRPINASNSFTPFEPLKVLDLDNVYANLKLPKMPPVLSSHDIQTEDWNRCMQDLARSWLGQLPVPRIGSDGPPRKSRLAQDLIELWNTSFFLRRGVELVLFKGKDRRTKSHSGLVHPNFYRKDDDSDSNTTSNSSEEFERSAFGSYEWEDNRRKNNDKKKHRKIKGRPKPYTVFVACVRGSYGAGYSPQGFPTQMPAGASGYPPIVYGTPQMGYAPSPASAYASPYNPAMGIPKTHSRGSGGGY